MTLVFFLKIFLIEYILARPIALVYAHYFMKSEIKSKNLPKMMTLDEKRSFILSNILPTMAPALIEITLAIDGFFIIRKLWKKIIGFISKITGNPINRVINFYFPADGTE